MTHLTAIVRDGKIEVVAPNDLSDGTEVTLLIVRNGIFQDLDSTEDPQETHRILQAMEQFEATFPVDEGGDDLSQVDGANLTTFAHRATPQSCLALHSLRLTASCSRLRT